MSKEDKLQGRFSRIDALSWSEDTPLLGWIKGLDFPVLLHRQVFTNKDSSTGTLYLACSDLDLQALDIETIYQKRWRVEVFHKTLKSDAALAKSPTKRVRTQSNHVFMALYAAFRVECLRIKHHLKNHVLKTKLYMKAIRAAFEQEQGGEPSRAKVLVCAGTGAVVGLAMWSWDPLWPQTCLLDCYCHPQYSIRSCSSHEICERARIFLQNDFGILQTIAQIL